MRGALKGARINRKSSPSQLSNPSHVRMDLDEIRTFPIHASIREEVLEQIRHDADLLAKHNIMDYSLLVGVVHRDDEGAESAATGKKKKKRRNKHMRHEEEEEELGRPRLTQADFSQVWKTGLPSTGVLNEHYLFGIIDILQNYNTFKKAAHALKVVVFRTSVRSLFPLCSPTSLSAHLSPYTASLHLKLSPNVELHTLMMKMSCLSVRPLHRQC